MKIGFTELIIVFIVALFVIGPDQLPEFARKLGEGFAAFRKYSNEATKDIKESIVEPLEEAQRPLREAMAPVEELKQEVEDNIKEVKSSISGIGKPRKDSGSGTADARKREEEKPEASIDTEANPVAEPDGQPESSGEPEKQPEASADPQLTARTETAGESEDVEESEDVVDAVEYSENSRDEGEDVI